MKKISHTAGVVYLVLSLLISTNAQVSLSTSSPSWLIDFETGITGVSSGPFDGIGFAPAPLSGQLDSRAWSITGFSDGDLLFGATAVSGDLARGAISGGGTSIGGLYALADFPSPDDRALAVQPGGTDFTPGAIVLKIVNLDPNEIIVQLHVSYDIYERNDSDRSSSFLFSHSPDGLSFTGEAVANHFTAEAADLSPSFVKIGGPGPSRSLDIQGLAIPTNGGEYFIRWDSDDFSGSGSRDEIAIDNVSVTGIFIGTTAATGRITGRALDVSGRPIPFARIELNGQDLKANQGTFTNQFGYFSFDGLETGNAYVLRAISRRYIFDPPLIAVTLDDELERVAFTGRLRKGGDTRSSRLAGVQLRSAFR